MNLLEHVSLKSSNSFGLDVKARFLADIGSLDDFQEIRTSKLYQTNPQLILGGGSNVLFTQDFPGIILRNQFRGITVLNDNPDHQLIEIGAGENWHDFVVQAVNQGLGGVENLSLIPGTVGAAPMQNIGAYGVEIKEVFQELTAIELASSELRRFDWDSCEFGYRTSVFKTRFKDKYLINSVTLKLSKNPILNVEYAGVREKLEEMNLTFLDVKAVSDAVIAIRRQKLPDPEQIGNAGSFFKNPIIDSVDFEGLQAEFKSLPSYQVTRDLVKIPAAWLIDQCGWKGKRQGQVGVHEKQPLVLVNYGSGTGLEIKNLARKIQSSVADTFGINLEPEVNVI